MSLSRCLQGSIHPLRHGLAILLAMWLVYVPVKAIAACSLLLCGAGGSGAVASTYQGPGDVVSGASIWGSCARAYNAAYANGTNSLCDLVDSAAPSTPICTLRVLTTGFVDLSAYCSGSVTPAAKCAAATGGVCQVSKVYDQSGNANHFIEATGADQPTLTFNAASTGLPAITCSGSPRILASTSTFTQAQPFTFAAVSDRTAVSGTTQYMGAFANSLGHTSVANTGQINAGSNITFSQNDNALNGVIATFNGASGAYNINGSDVTSQNFGAGTLSGNSIRWCTGNNSTFLNAGLIFEEGMWITITPANRGSLYTNWHGANGYNGAF